MEAARDALGTIHQTPIGAQPPITVHLHVDQVEALRSLLGLVRYDELATAWLDLLPETLRPEDRNEKTDR